MRFLAISLFFIQHFTLIRAQEYSWKYYSVADGLPQTQIYALHQDAKGYIWIGTKGGLSKFDGIEFENYTSNDGLSFDFIAHISEDTVGGIYLGTKKGTNYLNNGRVQVLDLGQDYNTIFHFITRRGVMWFYSGTDGLSIFRNGIKIEDHPVTQNFTDEESLVGISLNPVTHEVIINKSNYESLIWNGETIREIPKNDNGIKLGFSSMGLLFGMNADSLFRYENGKYFPVLSRKGLIIREIISFDEIYYTDRSTNTKLFLYDGERSHQFHQSFNMILDVLKDDESNLWVGTESGLWRLQSYGFKNYLSDRDNNFYTWSVTQDKLGNYLFGSFLHGLMTHDGETFRKVPVDHMFKDNGYQFFYSGHYVDEEGNIFLGNAQGIIKYDGAEYSWFYKHVPNDAILYIYYDEQEQRLLCTSSRHGLIEIDMNGKVYEHRDRTRRENTGLETSVVRDKLGRIWLSGKQGISIKEKGQWRNLPDVNDSISIGAISMIKDYKGNLWLGSNDGLYLYDYVNLEKIGDDIFDQQIGVLNITEDQELLIGAIGGIGLLSLQSYYENGNDHIRYFDANNGFLGTECKHNSSFKDNAGNIWICTSDRVVMVNPKALHSNQNPPRVYIESISTLSENMEWTPATTINRYNDVYEFKAHHDDLRFNYHGINHSAPNGVRYQSMLEGYDVSWSAPSGERYRTYTNLPHGQFEFKVKAYNNDGIESNFNSIKFTVLPSWYERSSIRIGGSAGLLLLAGLFGFFYSERIRKKRLSTEKNEKRIAKLQFKAVQGLIDPHFTFNAINSIAAMVYKENREEAYKYFTKFSKLIRSAFDTSDNTTRTIREEMTFVSNYLDIEKMRFKDRFNYQIDIAKNVNYDWKIPKMVVQIHVENSIKHGLVEKENGGLIGIKILIEGDFLNISVKDNGIGRASSREKSKGNNTLGRGTGMMKEYFKLMNKYNELKISEKTIDLVNSSGNPSGTEILIEIPLSYRYSI